MHQVASLVVPIHRLSERLRGVAEGAVKPYNLLPTEFEILQSLLLADRDRGLSPSELYQALLMSSGGVTKLINLLVDKRLICTKPDPSDGRGKRILLTDRGAEIGEKATAAVVTAEAALLAQAFGGHITSDIAPRLVAAITRLENA